MKVLALGLLSLGAVAVFSIPWVPWAPTHDPPFTCSEMLGMQAYGEWSHQWAADRLRNNGTTINGWTLQEELRWVAWYQRVRPMIETGCQDAPALPMVPLDPIIESP